MQPEILRLSGRSILAPTTPTGVTTGTAAVEDDDGIDDKLG